MIEEKENYVCPECMVLHFEVQNIMAGVSGNKGDTGDGGEKDFAKPGEFFEEFAGENNGWED
jgi:hypothetical protein